jgi:hypothetical protein
MLKPSLLCPNFKIKWSKPTFLKRNIEKIQNTVRNDLGLLYFDRANNTSPSIDPTLNPSFSPQGQIHRIRQHDIQPLPIGGPNT